MANPVTMITASDDRKAKLLRKLSLIVLTVQTSGIVLAIRYAHIRPVTGPPHLPTTMVFWTECVKLAACLSFVCIEAGCVFKGFRTVYDALIRKPWDTLKIWVPSIIYTVQNNLFYVGVSNLDAATFAVTYQLKLLSTALMAVAMLRQPLSRLQWFSLLLLASGVAIVQVQEHQQQQALKDAASEVTSKPNDLNFSVGRDVHVNYANKQNAAVGLGAVLCVCATSAFAGVYFEKVLKSDDKVSLWMQNVRLAIFGAPVALAGAFITDGAKIHENGFNQGYDSFVWFIVMLYALGGLLVAMCIKYADNILKGFSQSCAVVISCAASVVLFGFRPTWLFLVGTGFVATAVYVYSRFPVPKAQDTIKSVMPTRKPDVIVPVER